LLKTPASARRQFVGQLRDQGAVQQHFQSFHGIGRNTIVWSAENLVFPPGQDIDDFDGRFFVSTDDFGDTFDDFQGIGGIERSILDFGHYFGSERVRGHEIKPQNNYLEQQEMGTVVYVSMQCPNCLRLLKTLDKLQLKVKVINIDRTRVDGLTAVPTVNDRGTVHVGTKAFEWVQAYESQVPLEAYATVLGEGAGGLSYTDLDTDETVASTLFTPF
jgi:glutaredoxin